MTQFATETLSAFQHISFDNDAPPSPVPIMADIEVAAASAPKMLK